MKYLADMGMSFNVRKCVYATTSRIYSIMVLLDPNNAGTVWICLMAKSTVPYLDLRLDPKGMAPMKEKQVRCEALMRQCKNNPGPAWVPHEVMATVVGGIVRYAVSYLLDTEADVVQLNAARKTAARRFENLPKDLSNVAVRSSKELKLAHIGVLCRDSVVVSVAQLTHHRSAVIKGELRALLDNLHT